MAIVDLVWKYTVSIMDNSGIPVPRTYEAPIANFADFDAFQAGAIALDTLLLLLTDGVISKREYSLVTVEDAITLPASGVENENQMFFSGKVFGDPTDSATQSIPSADPDFFMALSGPGANVVNTTNATVISWLALFDSTGPWTISDGEAWIPATVKGKRRHSKNSNG